ncbi:MAG: dihydrodipicolinate synthase family protein [Bryobacteraceae bacterium]
MSKAVQGVYAAVTVARTEGGKLNEAGLHSTLEFLASKGMRRFVLNGATGEYCLTTPGELRRMLAAAGEIPGAEWLCAIGSAGWAGCVQLGELALAGGAKALLLPMPHFFPYSQDDLRAFCETVAARLPAPILLYNLPRFTTPLEPATVESLVASVANILGVKDSSGRLEILSRLPETACRIVGDDSALAAALEAGVCDGVVSGCAGVLPELLTDVYRGRGQAAARLDEFIAQLARFPVPWGLKLAAECRGMAPASFAQPLSAVRREQAAQFQRWFRKWMEESYFFGS